LRSWLALLCALAPACSNPAPEPSSSPPPAASTPASTSPTAMTHNAFTLEYLTTGGPELGAGVQQYQTRLVIDGGTGIATLDTVRAGGDAEALPIGRFEATMTAAELADISGRAGAIVGGTAGTRGGPGTSSIVLRYRSDASSWEHALNSNDPAGLAPFDPLLEPLNLMIGRLYATPSAALGIELVPGATQSAPFVVRLKNLGRVELAVLDPSPLGAADEDAWAGVRIAAFPVEQAGVTSGPLEWERVALQPGAGTGPRKTLVLGVGQQLEWQTRAWKAKTPGRQLVQAIVVDYAGDATIDGRPHVRGALFSTALEHTP
jgi:hypothetical protein